MKFAFVSSKNQLEVKRLSLLVCQMTAATTTTINGADLLLSSSIQMQSKRRPTTGKGRRRRRRQNCIRLKQLAPQLRHLGRNYDHLPGAAPNHQSKASTMINDLERKVAKLKLGTRAALLAPNRSKRRPQSPYRQRGDIRQTSGYLDLTRCCLRAQPKKSYLSYWQTKLDWLLLAAEFCITLSVSLIEI